MKIGPHLPFELLFIEFCVVARINFYVFVLFVSVTDVHSVSVQCVLLCDAGEVLRGDRIVNTPYNVSLSFLTISIFCTELKLFSVVYSSSWLL